MFGEILILSCGIAVLYYNTKGFAVFRKFRVISMRLAVFLCYSARC